LGQKEIFVQRFLKVTMALPKALGLGPKPLSVLGPGVWLQAHCLDDYWPFMHCSVRVSPSDPAPHGPLLLNRDAQGLAWFTLGAGPVEGKLVNGFNRPRDVNAPKVYAECLVSGGAEEAALIQRLLDAAGRYRNDEPFAPVSLPGSKAHNCNAYVAALLAQAQAPPPKHLPPAWLIPGYASPLPASDFI